MKRTVYHRILTVIASLFFAFSADAEDQIIAKFENYLVIVRSDKIGSMTMLFRVEAKGKQALLSTDADGTIASKIESLLPRKEAWALIKQIVDWDIKNDGGVKKCQHYIDEDIRKNGKDVYSYLTPMEIEAYRARGVVIPYTPKGNGSK